MHLRNISKKNAKVPVCEGRRGIRADCYEHLPVFMALRSPFGWIWVWSCDWHWLRRHSKWEARRSLIKLCLCIGGCSLGTFAVRTLLEQQLCHEAAQEVMQNSLHGGKLRFPNNSPVFAPSYSQLSGHFVTVGYPNTPVTPKSALSNHKM